MTIVSEISWEAVASPDFGTDRAAWREAVAQIASKAKEKLPGSEGRIERAVQLVLSGDVEILQDGTARVASQGNGSKHYLVINGHCPCALHKQHDTKELECGHSPSGVLESPVHIRLIPASDGL